MLDLRVRACHVTGSFATKDNKRGAYSGQHRLSGPPRFEYGRLSHPPALFAHERLKIEDRLPAAQGYIRQHKLNETLPGDIGEIGIIILGGLTNALLRALARIDLADLFGTSRIPIYVLNVAYPLIPEEVKGFCTGKRAVLVVEEGSPDYVEQQINVELRRADIQTRVLGKGCLPKAGDYNSEVLLRGLAAFLAETRPAGIDADAITARVDKMLAHKPAVTAAVGDIPARPPNFCTGCPERPVFTAIKLTQREIGPTHISADIGCHSFATFAPFSLGNSILGYGMSLASAAAVTPNMERRPIAIMGDGGFWHNGLITGVASNLFNKGDGVLIVMQNGYASATGQQYLPSSNANRSGTPTGMTIEQTLRSFGVKWLRTVHTYSVAKMVVTLKEAMRTAERGLKVIIADGECMLARQRRIRADDAEKLKRGERVVKTRYGVDDEICTGDHSCIRLSGCPSLTVKPNPDPLRTDPVATVIESCVGCGLCGEVAHAAVLCPSFYRADIIRNPSWWDRALNGVRRTVIGWLGGDGREHAAAFPPPLWGRDREGGTPLARSSANTPHPNPPPQGGREHAAPAAMPENASARPLAILIAALGGEGGGVLTDWMVAAAASQGFPVQSTSIPGVAQRTGATTYYVEMLPTPQHELGDRKPILALSPGVGDVDLVVASELMEAGRAIAGGFVTKDRTRMIASTSRSYLVVEKMQMGDGRYDQQRLVQAVEDNSRDALLLDLETIAHESGAMMSAVMLGTIAGGGQLPIPVEAFEAAIRADGKAVDSNLRGFRAGFDAARQAARGETIPGKRQRAPSPSLADLEREIELMPAAARAFMVEGVRRLAAYQDLAYARLYLDRLVADPRRGRARQCGRKTAGRDRAASRGAHVLRGRHSRGAGQDRPDAHQAHRSRHGREGRSALRRDGIPQAGHRGILLGPAAIAGAAHPRVRRTPSYGRARALGHGDQHQISLRLPAVLPARQIAPAAPAHLALSGGAARHRDLARPHRSRRAVLGRACARDRRMRAAHQRLWRHAQARQRKLSPDRDTGDRADAGGPHTRGSGRGCNRQRAHRGVARSRWRSADEVPRRSRLTASPRHRRRIAASRPEATRHAINQALSCLFICHKGRQEPFAVVPMFPSATIESCACGR